MDDTLSSGRCQALANAARRSRSGSGAGSAGLGQNELPVPFDAGAGAAEPGCGFEETDLSPAGNRDGRVLRMVSLLHKSELGVPSATSSCRAGISVQPNEKAHLLSTEDVKGYKV